jgi:hypothetical protein
MLRTMIKSVGRYEAGNNHDFPKGVWDKIAGDLMKDPKNAALAKEAGGDAQKFLDLVSNTVDINTSLQSVTRGPIKLRQRTGGAPRIPARGGARA